MKYGTDKTTSLHIACKHGYVDITDFLIEKGADTNMKCENGRIALHYASSGLHYDIVDLLLRNSPNTVEERDKKNQTPLQLVLNTHKINENKDETVKIARLLVEKGANPDTANDELNKVIHIAAHNGNYNFLAYLLDKYELDVNGKNKYGNTPLLYAVAASKLIPEDHMKDTMKLLIKYGADIKTINNDDRSILHFAAEFCRYKIITYLFQEHNISVDTPDNNGETPLFRAMGASKSIPEDDVMATVKLLIENGANVGAIINNGCNLLHVASDYCHGKIISYLIREHTISIHKTDKYGRTPLCCVLIGRESKSEDDVMATFKLLIENGASVDTITNDGRSLLHDAARYCHYKIISYFIQEHNISIDTPDNNDATPLFCAMGASKSIPEDDVMATVKLLIENGANVGAIINNGCNLLHVASDYCHGKIISYLIREHTISIHKTDKYGRTPLCCVLIGRESKSEDDVMATFKLLIENGASVETITNDGSSLLHFAAEFCHYKIITYLIKEHNISVDTRDSLGRTSLYWALLANKQISEDDVMATFKLLVENGASVETITNDGSSLLHFAAEFCHYKIITYLIKEHNISVDTRDSLGRTSLYWALLANKQISEDDVMATFKLLVENGASVETITNDGSSLLHFAAEFCHYKIITYLIKEHNISVDTRDSFGRTSLYCALLANKQISEDDVMATFKLLVENGASVETIANNGSSLLHIAAEFCHYKIINYLIKEHNISVDTRDSLGRTSLYWALLANKQISEDDVMATFKLLVENGASVETITNDGSSLLHFAAEFCHYKIITYLIKEHNISVDTRDSFGRTSLYCALLANKQISEDDVMATFKLLVENGASVETIINDGSSLLHFAAQFCHYKIINYLIKEHNISVDTRDSFGRTSLYCALLANKQISEDDVMATFKLLVENGASVETIANNGSSLLHIAAEFCHYKIINYLIKEHNISVDTRDSLGRTSLYWALLANKQISEDDVMATFKLLVENGASVETITNNGSSLLHFAAEFCHYKIITYLIKDHNISVDTRDSFGRTSLYCALLANKQISEEDVMATFKLLVENGASVETITNDGSSLLHFAAEFCHFKIITYLIKEHNISVDTPDSSYNINIDTKDEGGNTPLHCALLADESINQETVKKIIEILLSSGASINLKNDKHQTVLDLASPEIREFILSKKE